MPDAGAILDEPLAAEAPAITMESSEEDIVREFQVRNGLTMLPESKRLAAVESAVRAQFGERAARPHRRRAGLQDLKSRKRDILRPHPGRCAAVPGRRGRRAPSRTR